MKSTDIIKASTNSLNIYSFTAEALERLIEAVKAEQSCKTCEALARTVMLDQTSHDAQRKPLTDEAKAVIDAARAAMDDSVEAYDSEGSIKISSDLAASLSLCLDEYDRAIEAKLQEKNA